MNFAWKFVLPLDAAESAGGRAWRFLGDGWERWVVCSAIVVLLAYVGMGWSGMRRGHFGPRSYRYAE
jgi:hypothetical protein